MEFLYLLEKIRNPVSDFFFSLVTHLGEETVFLAIAIIFFWCIDKYRGYYVLMTGLLGTVINQWLKIVCRVPRPWVKDPDFTTVKNAQAEAGGYSFPSGHTQNIAGTFGAIGATSKKRWFSIVTLVIIVLVAFSRMYLGVHTPADVCVSLLIAAAMLAILYPVFSSKERFDKYMPYIVAVSVLITAAFVIYVNLLNPADYAADITVNADGEVHDPLGSALKNAATMLGCMVGLLVVYPLDRFVIKFETKAPWYAQIIKLVLGLAIVLGIKSGLSKPLVALFGNEYVARGVRYFLIVVFAGTVWPMTFKFFSKMRIPCLDKIGNKERET